jgi:hypothetical protein
VSTSRRRLRLGAILAECGRLLAARYGFPIAAAVAVFVPLGLIDALELNAADVDGLHGPSAAVVLLVTLLFGSLTLLGEVLYSGLITRAVVDRRSGESHRIGEIIRTLPYRRLIAADLLLVGAVAAGFLLFVVPGLIVLAWFALVAPVIEVERPRLRAAFRRSRELVKRDFWRAALLIVVVAFLSDLLGEFIQVAISDALGNSTVAEWAGSAVSGMIAAPLFALPVVVLYLELAAAPAAASSRPSELAAAATSSGTVPKR